MFPLGGALTYKIQEGSWDGDYRVGLMPRGPAESIGRQSQTSSPV